MIYIYISKGLATLGKPLKGPMKEQTHNMVWSQGGKGKDTWKLMHTLGRRNIGRKSTIIHTPIKGPHLKAKSCELMRSVGLHIIKEN